MQCQGRGLTGGLERGAGYAVVPATVVAAASFDDAIAITGYTIFINLAVSPDTSPGWSIAHGPLSLVFGVIGGVLAGTFCAFTKLWNTNTKRIGVLFIVGVLPCLPLLLLFGCSIGLLFASSRLCLCRHFALSSLVSGEGGRA